MGPTGWPCKIQMQEDKKHQVEVETEQGLASEGNEIVERDVCVTPEVVKSSEDQ